MKPQTLGLRVASGLFGAMAVVQLARLIFRPEVLVAGYRMPLWPSALAFVILAGLSFWLWNLAKSGNNNK